MSAERTLTLSTAIKKKKKKRVGLNDVWPVGSEPQSRHPRSILAACHVPLLAVGGNGLERWQAGAFSSWECSLCLVLFFDLLPMQIPHEDCPPKTYLTTQQIVRQTVPFHRFWCALLLHKVAHLSMFPCKSTVTAVRMSDITLVVGSPFVACHSLRSAAVLGRQCSERGSRQNVLHNFKGCLLYHNWADGSGHMLCESCLFSDWSGNNIQADWPAR